MDKTALLTRPTVHQILVGEITVITCEIELDLELSALKCSAQLPWVAAGQALPPRLSPSHWAVGQGNCRSNK